MLKAETVKKALELVRKRGTNYEYFFNQLNTPEWIEPLSENGLFKNPPSPVREGDYISFPVWPESRYLARVAAKAPELVIITILKVPETENIRVHEDFADAILAMPPDASVKLVPNLDKWLLSPYQLLLPEKAGRIIAHLSSGGKISAAFHLAKSLLRLTIDKLELNEEDQDMLFRPRPKLRGNMPSWEYERILTEDIPTIIQASGVRGVQLLCELLDGGLQLIHDHSDEWEDYSYIWRRDIADDTNHYYAAYENPLVSAIRDGTTRVVTDDQSSVSDMVAVLEDWKWTIFRRMALFLLCDQPDIEIIRKHLHDYNSFHDVSIRHEYNALLRMYFPKLEETEQKDILDWIEAGPKYIQKRDHTNEDDLVAADAWRCDRLFAIVPYLPPVWSNTYKELVEKLGEPEHLDDPVCFSTTWVGPKSPISITDIENMDIKQLAEYLNSWKSNVFPGPTPEGLGRNISSVVGSNPADFADNALSFVGLDPTYVRALFEGLHAALKEQRQFDWSKPIELALWVINQCDCDIESGSSRHLDKDPSWEWTRLSIARLLEDGMRVEDSDIPYELRNSVWSILNVLVEDTKPTPDYEKEYGGSNMGPVTMSINTVRGEAMHAIMKYALFWAPRHNGSKETGKMEVKGLDITPEAKAVLTRHLDPLVDPSLGVRSVYGMYLPWLYQHDSAWTKAHLPDILPTSLGCESMFDAAWNAYVVYCEPYNALFLLLKTYYLHATDNLIPERERNFGGDPGSQLTEHLVTFYWRGIFNLDKQTDPLSLFFQKAPSELRSHAIDYIGRSLSTDKNDVPEDALRRIQELWEWRLEVAKSAESIISYRAELTAFGWWFLSAKLPAEWTTQNLKAVLNLVGHIEPDYLVAERLVEVAQKDPITALYCIKKMFDGSESRRQSGMWIDEARKVLEVALANKVSQNEAIDTINVLAAKGYVEELRGLLSE